MRSKFANNAFLNFNLMNNFLAASAIMRSKLFKFAKLYLWLIISHLCIKTFDLMIALAANKSSVDLLINIIEQIQSHEKVEF
jgi:hypothetical protein